MFTGAIPQANAPTTDTTFRSLGLDEPILQAVERIGLPEAEYHLAHATIALSMAPKSNSVAKAMSAAMR